MQRKIIIFVGAVLGIILALSLVSIVLNQREYKLKESKIEPAVKNFIEIFNNVDKPEYKTMYWEFLSQVSRNRLIQQTGSLEAAQAEVWRILQRIVDSQCYVEFLGIEHLEIKGNIATVVVRVRTQEGNQEPVETTKLHKYRWENGKWKFIDSVIEREMYGEQ